MNKDERDKIETERLEQQIKLKKLRLEDRKLQEQIDKTDIEEKINETKNPKAAKKELFGVEINLRFFLIVGFILLVVIGGFYSINSPTPIPRIKVSSKHLAEMYKKNEIGAEMEYTGKLAEVSGDLSSVKEVGGLAEINLKTYDLFQRVVCKMSMNTPELGTISVGEELTVYGTIIGVPGMMNVVIEPCSFDINDVAP